MRLPPCRLRADPRCRQHVVQHQRALPANTNRPYSGALRLTRRLARTAAGSRTRPSPNSTTRGEPRQAPRRRWPWPASGPAREPNPTGSSPATAAAGSRGRSGWQTWPPSLATGRGVAADRPSSQSDVRRWRFPSRSRRRARPSPSSGPDTAHRPAAGIPSRTRTPGTARRG